MIAIGVRPAIAARRARCIGPLLTMLAVTPVLAVQAVRPYEVTTSSTDAPTAFLEALRMALVRATGVRAAADSPSYAALRAEPRRFVRSFRLVSGGLQVTLDGAALDRAIVAAGGRLWPRAREVVLVGFETGAAPSGGSAWRDEVERAAGARGLPVQSIATALDPELDAASALEAARAAGADVTLIGSRAASGVVGEWRWRLVTRAGVEEWTGSLADAIDTAADRLASAAIARLEQPEANVAVEISGVTTLTDYVRAERLLGAVAGVSGVSLLELGAGRALFEVAVRGGAAGLVDALATHPAFVAGTAGGDRIGYALRPD